MTQHTNREAWLLAAVNLIRPIFLAKHHEIPSDVMVYCGFASTGTRSHHIGQCWSRGSSSNELNQIFISPTLHEPVEVLDTLVHELVHAVDNCEHKHGKEFKKIALSLGMQSQMRRAGVEPGLKKTQENQALKVSHRRVVSKARVRAKCPACGFHVPMYKKFLEYGQPICPKDRVEMDALGDWEVA